jgi:hypothetical protein
VIRSDRVFILASMVCVLVLFIWGVTVGQYPFSANVFPALTSAGVVVFGLLALREGATELEGVAFSWIAVVWLLAVLPLIFLLGFRIGLPLYAFAYALARNTHPLVSLVLAAGIAAMIEILFVHVLALPLGWGWLVEKAL